ncbi:MAG: ligase-associated DNA damage response exonuclease [Bacteroidia bacterium]|nr:ligase-associated DNA damage response exonuclease [Bacteroidia bacterium]
MKLLKFTKKGIYCPQGNFYIDPWSAVEKAVITHGHSDHAKAGHKFYLCSEDSKPILKHRLGIDNCQTLEYGESIFMNGVKLSLHPAGHILGSAQVRLEFQGDVWVVTGDYKTENDGISTGFELVKCNKLITESTFGLPVYKWTHQSIIQTEINSWWKQNQDNGKVSILCGYALGKAQRLISLLDPEIGTIYTHGAVDVMTRIYHECGVVLPETTYANPELKKSDYKGSIVVCPPSAISGTWVRKFGNSSVAFASGWMAVRGSRRRRSADRGFALSDHADWKGLNDVVKDSGAEKVYVTHGYTDIYSRWLNEQGIDSKIVQTEFEGEAEL